MLAKVKDSTPTALTRKSGTHGSLDNRKVHDRKVSGGKVQPSPTSAMAQSQLIQVKFDPAAPLPGQFIFNNVTTPPLNRKLYFPVTQQTTITFTPLDGTDLPPTPVQWIYPQNPPSGPTFTVDPPEHYNSPWIFTLNVNYGGVNNIMSPPFYLVKASDFSVSVSLQLQYNDQDGSFQLLNEDGHPVIDLVSQSILLNVLPAIYNITLAGATGVTFNQENPIVWASGTVLSPITGWPPWITPLGWDENTLKFSIPGPIGGQSAGFQFAINVPSTKEAGSITVLSPDPIIINATIGDG